MLYAVTKLNSVDVCSLCSCTVCSCMSAICMPEDGHKYRLKHGRASFFLNVFKCFKY